MTASISISGTGFTTITLSVTDGETTSPMPSDYQISYKRAIVENQPIQVEYSIGQDMGQDSVQITLTGLITQTQKGYFVTLANLGQFAAAKGPVTIALTGGDSIQSWSYAGCALTAFGFKPVAGSEVFYRYTAKFIQFNGQS